MFKHSIIAALFLLIIQPLAAQDDQWIVEATRNVRYDPVTQSKTAAQEKAFELAKLYALEKKFGTAIVSSVDLESSTTTVNEESKTTTKLDVVGNTTIKGEIIEVISKDFKDYTRKEKIGDSKKRMDFHYVECKVKVRVRELKSPKIDIKTFATASNQLFTPKENFEVGDDFYLFFQSAQSGFITVFLDDGKHAQRLFPYSEMPAKFEQGVPIDSDKPYVFFSPEHRYFPDDGFRVDELQFLDQEKDQELNHIYVIYSQTPLNKPVLRKNQNNDLLNEYQKKKGYTLPAMLKSSEFKQWRIENLTLRPDMQIQHIFITITK